MSEAITKRNAHGLGAPYYRTVKEACEETRRDENHSAFLKAEMEKAWGEGNKEKYKRLSKESTDYTFNVSCERRDIRITPADCKVWPDLVPAKGRSRSGEFMIIHMDWPEFMPRKYRYEDSLVFEDEAFVFNLYFKHENVRAVLAKVDGGEG